MIQKIPASILDYDASRAVGTLEVEGRTEAFPITSFFGYPSNRAPKKSERVNVVFRQSGGKVLAVLAVDP